ncbi:MAG: hypothetical protein N2Z74_03930, partial [Syntrophales bacterium]|nr:hypothetical protein [Syntrophales bacterium]
METFFIIKKIVSPLLYPLSVSLILLLVSFIMLLRKKPRRTGKVLLFCGIVVLVAASYTFLSDRFVRLLEDRYPPVMSTEPLIKQHIRTIVVLGGGVHPSNRMPLGLSLIHI